MAIDRSNPLLNGPRRVGILAGPAAMVNPQTTTPPPKDYKTLYERALAKEKILSDTFISYETARAAKKAGFNSPCAYFYGRTFPASDFKRLHTDLESFGGDFSCFAPLQAILAKWLRETHHLHVNVQHNQFYQWQVQVQDIKGYDGTERTADELWLAHDYGTYESALEEGLRFALGQIYLRT